VNPERILFQRLKALCKSAALFPPFSKDLARPLSSSDGVRASCVVFWIRTTSANINNDFLNRYGRLGIRDIHTDMLITYMSLFVGQLPRIRGGTGWRPRDHLALGQHFPGCIGSPEILRFRDFAIPGSRQPIDCHRDHSRPASFSILAKYIYSTHKNIRIQVAANAPQGCHLGLCSAFVVFLFSPNCSLLVAQLDLSRGSRQGGGRVAEVLA